MARRIRVPFIVDAAPACDPTVRQSGVFCFDTALPGSSNAGHTYGTDLAPNDKADLLAYLPTF